MKIQFTTILFILALNGFALQSMVPKTHFEFWNDSQVVSGNNCYNYSTNRQTDSYAQPGEASDKKYDSLLCQNVVTAAEADLGLESTPYFPISERDEETLVALVVAPGYDYHWYRRDSSGWWTHKMGWLPATNLDNAKLPIPDPESADRGKYTDFCGYFKIRNFPTAQHQQNSGFVRIGNMKELPRVGEEPAPASPDPISEVAFLIYSGRPNPTFPLKKLLNSPALGNLLRAAALDLSAARTLYRESALVKSDWENPRLGYNGIAVHDTQGLIFPKGATVFLGGTNGYTIEESGRRLYMAIPQAKNISRDLETLVMGMIR